MKNKINKSDKLWQELIEIANAVEVDDMDGKQAVLYCQEMSNLIFKLNEIFLKKELPPQGCIEE